MRRRHWLLAGAGLTAAARGWAGPVSEPAEVAPEALWQGRFAMPQGGELAMATLRGTPLVLNFWATWCPPCLKEMPEFDRFQREFAAQGWRVVGLAIDNPAAVRDYLARTPVSYTIGVAGMEGSTLTRLLGNEQGGLPYTVVLDRRGMLVHRKRGPTNHAELAAWARVL
jgi:thiol-disulfide isomerase/thioredoxin